MQSNLNRGSMSPWKRVEQFFFDPIDPIVYAVPRILLGFAIFCHYAAVLPDFFSLYGESGLTRFMGHASIVFPEPIMMILFAIILLVSIFYSAGLWTKASGFATFVIHQYFYTISPASFYGWANIFQAFLLYSLVADSGAALSIDGQRNHTSPRKPSPRWPLRLAQLHLCAIYFGIIIHRTNQTGWLTGSMVFNILDDPFYARFNFGELYPLLPVLKPVSWLALAIEAFVPILLWVKQTRIWAIIILAGFHVSLDVLTLTDSWQIFMLAGISAFIPIEVFYKFDIEARHPMQYHKKNLLLEKI